MRGSGVIAGVALLVLTANEVLCWGYNYYGQLGYGHTDDIGDDESPVSAGPVPLF